MAPIKTTATTKPAAETAMPRQEGMTHSDSMDIVTPKTKARVRKAAPIGSVPVVDDEVSPQGKRRRRWLLVLLILLFALLGFWLGRLTYRAPAVPVDIQPPVPARPVLPPPAPTVPAPAAHTVPTTPAVTAATVVAAAPAVSVAETPSAAQPVPATNLLEVSVGTSVRGGLTLKFDQPVDWIVLGNDGQGSAEVDVLGVRDLGTFPRNLPLPPGVKQIHAGILEPDTLRLRFTLLPNVRAITAPANGPASALNVFFRTAAEGRALPALPRAVQASGGCGVAGGAQVGKAIALLESSVDKNPSYSEVRMALATLTSCGGDGARAEQLLSDGLKAGGNPGLQLVAADAALRFARGDSAGALALLKSNAASAKGDAAYAELIADLQSAAK